MRYSTAELLSACKVHDRRLFLMALAASSLSIAGCEKKSDSKAESSLFDWTSLVLTAFESLGADDDAIRRKASQYDNVQTWRRVSDFDVTMAGGGACALPLSGYASLPVEFGYLMRQIYNSTLGIGYILYGSATKDDFATILAQWGNEYIVTSAVLGPVYAASEAALISFGRQTSEVAAERAADKALNILGRTGANAVANAAAKAKIVAAAKQVPQAVISKVLAHHSGSLILGKIGAKVAAKVGAKFGAKYGAKVAAIWVPAVSGIVCGGVNWWLMDGILTTSEVYFKTLARFRAERYLGANK